MNQIFMVIFSCCQDLSSEMSGATEDGKKNGRNVMLPHYHKEVNAQFAAPNN